jgi:capsid assembly protease
MPEHDGRAAAFARWLTSEDHVWAITPGALAAIVDLGHRGDLAAAARTWAAEGIEDSAMAAALARRGPQRAAGGQVAVINITGLITPQGPDLFDLIFGMGGTGMTGLRSQVRDAIGDESVSGIALNIDSPGGLVDMVPEVGEELRAARDQKPVVAVANTLAASAAYWLGAQASEFYVTPSGEAGSIGVYAQHRDVSGAMERLGVVNTLVSAGKYKVEGHPYAPLDEEARGAIQQSVDDYYQMFLKAVGKGRGVTASKVRDGYGEGRVLTAQRAVDAQLADGVMTFEEAVQRLAKGSVKTGRARAEADDAGAEDEGAEADDAGAVLSGADFAFALSDYDDDDHEE